MKLHPTPLLAMLLVLAFGLTAALPVVAAPTPLQSDPAEMEAFFDGLIADQMHENHLPGAVIVVVKDGEVFFSKGYGYSDMATRKPVDPATTLFRPGSVSKLFTWTAVMQMVEGGKLRLDEDVNAYLDFTIPATYAEPITMRHLMTHTAGFEDRGDGLFKLRADEVINLETYLKQYLPARVFPPGVYGAYSNYSTALAGYIVQRLAGMPFEEYVEQHIFAPLGMEHASFRQPLPGALAPDMAGGYNFVNGRYVQGDFEFVVAHPAGALSASGLEMAKFMIAHLQDGRYGDAQILQEATARQMHAQLFTHDPRLSGMAHGFFEYQIHGRRVIAHGGDTLLFHSGLFLLPEENTGLFVSTNGAGGAAAVESVWAGFADRYYPAEDLPALTPAADFAQRAPLYTGQYYMARSNFTTIEKMFRAMSPVSVAVEDQEVVINLAGQVRRYVEVEPGLLVNTENYDDRMVMREDNGQVVIYPSIPFTFIKAGLFDTFELHMLIYIGGALLFLITLIRWALGVFRRGAGLTPLGRAARLTAAAFGLGFLALISVLISQVANILPAYNVPAIFFGIPAAAAQMFTILPVVMAVLALAMVAFSAALWARKAQGRGFYTVLTLFAAAIVWSLAYWNFLSVG